MGYAELVSNVWELVGWLPLAQGQFCILTSSQNVSPVGIASDTGISETCGPVSSPACSLIGKSQVSSAPRPPDWFLARGPCGERPWLPGSSACDRLPAVPHAHGRPGWHLPAALLPLRGLEFDDVGVDISGLLFPSLNC